MKNYKIGGLISTQGGSYCPNCGKTLRKRAISDAMIELFDRAEKRSSGIERWCSFCGEEIELTELSRNCAHLHSNGPLDEVSND